MASAVSGVPTRTTRRSTLESIDADLAALWREVADADAPIARAVMSNLVVVRDRADVPPGDIDTLTSGLPIDEVVARHPSRLLVLEHERGREDPPPSFAAAVGVLAFGPPHARYGIEQIVVRSACGEASVGSIVRGLIRGDLPTSIWWTPDLSARPPLDAFITIGRQLVYDSRRWRDVPAAIRVLAPLVADHRIDLADVNWRRLAPLRRALAHSLPADLQRSVAYGGDARIEHGSGDAALGWLLAGWLVSLGGERAKAQSQRPEMSVVAEGDTVVAVTFGQGQNETAISLTPRSVVITRGERSAPALIVGIPIEEECDAIAAELRMLSHDGTLQNTLAALVALVGPR